MAAILTGPHRYGLGLERLQAVRGWVGARGYAVGADSSIAAASCA